MSRFTKIFSFSLILSISMSMTTLAQAAQVVVLDLKAVGKTPQAKADAYTPVLISELGRVQGLSVVSRFDILALLEHEGNKQAMGCNDSECMTELAGALGAELLISSTFSQTDGECLVTLSLANVEEASVVNRSSGTGFGMHAGAAKRSIREAVHNLFAQGMPSELQGPASLSRRGFEAVLLGYSKAVIDPKADIKTLRKRLILDLVNTELDFDAKPKLDWLDLSVRRGISEIDRLLLLSKDDKDLERYLNGRQEWRTISLDLQRVKEIRTRSRERGMVPSARPLRFENPEPTDWPDRDEINKFWKASKSARAVVEKALKDYSKKNLKKFQTHWVKDGESKSKRAYEEMERNAKRYQYKWEMLPRYATAPWTWKTMVESHQKDPLKITVYLRYYKKGKIYDDDRVWMVKEDGKWKIQSW